VEPVAEVESARYDGGLVPEPFRYAHHADFIRLDAIIEHGGVYADIDTIFVRPFPRRLYDGPFVMGREQPVRDQRTGDVRPSLCNALLMAEPGAEFARAWREEMADSLDGSWSNHSGFLAHEISVRQPGQVRVERERSFFRFPPSSDGLAALLEGCEEDLNGVLSIHLWAHLWWHQQRRDYSEFHAGLLTEDQIRQVDTTYNRLARRYLPQEPSPL
jgi:hypothetical protein